ncbi:hypothetical protein GJ496_010351 [Pomphorhynchus laevis]|nr:hypothetical protein GJ496_010351 [Pomphorhynchus laevis]
MVVLSKGDFIWLPPRKPGEFVTNVGAQILNVRNGQLELETDDGERLVLPMDDSVKVIPKDLVNDAADMINLSELSESSIIRNLLTRYKNNNIYTYIGSILIAINPYQQLPVYGNDQIVKYKGKSLKDLPPHIYAIADVSYREMQSFSQPQTLTISGESGSGKTETTKFILKYLTYSSGQHSWIEQQILDSNPILEAFGNAKTIRNDNSSRFGKYIDIQFDKSGHILSAEILQYLLEKSRIVYQDKDERNYHIFYCMLKGLPQNEQSALFLQPNATYKYLNKVYFI